MTGYIYLKIYFKGIHANAELCRQLCLISDKIILKNEYKTGQTVFKNYKLLKKVHDKKTNFKTAAFKKNDEIIVCFVGTDPKNLKDNITNLKMGFGKVTKQMKQAKNFVKKIQFEHPKCKLITTGHSEGGSEALYTGLSFGIQVFSYNAFFLSDKIKNQALKNNRNKNFEFLINNYRTPKDLVSKLFYKDIGNTYIVENIKSRHAHALINMANCKTSIPIEIYKKEHPDFTDKIFTRLTLHQI